MSYNIAHCLFHVKQGACITSNIAPIIVYGWLWGARWAAGNSASRIVWQQQDITPQPLAEGAAPCCKSLRCRLGDYKTAKPRNIIVRSSLNLIVHLVKVIYEANYWPSGKTNLWVRYSCNQFEIGPLTCNARVFSLRWWTKQDLKKGDLMSSSQPHQFSIENILHILIPADEIHFGEFIIAPELLGEMGVITNGALLANKRERLWTL